MEKPKSSRPERQALIGLAHLSGMSDEQILRKIITGVRGVDNRRELIVEWGELMGLDASAALRKAQRAGLILTTRPPKSLQRKTQLPDKGRGKPS